MVFILMQVHYAFIAIRVPLLEYVYILWFI
jgi:hypothetical protein